MIPVTVIRHPRERLSKCSLTPLAGRADLTFLKGDGRLRFDASEFTVLAVGAPVLSVADANRPLLLLDSTWRLLPDLEKCLVKAGTLRSLPPVPTAYPRVSKLNKDPEEGLASVEALYLAKLLLGERDDTLLDDYHWRNSFLSSLYDKGFIDGQTSASR